MAQPKKKKVNKSNGVSGQITRKVLREMEAEMLQGRIEGFNLEYDALVRKWGLAHAVVIESVQVGNNVWGQAGKLALIEVEAEEETVEGEEEEEEGSDVGSNP